MQTSSTALGNLAGIDPIKLPPLVMDRHDAASYIGIGLRSLHELRRTGELVPINIAGRVLYPIAVLQDFVKQRTAAAIASSRPATKGRAP